MARNTKGKSSVGYGFTHARDLTDGNYLDRLGVESARHYAPLIKQQAMQFDATFPLDGNNLHQLLQNTIDGLERQGKLDWNHTPGIRQDIFINAWSHEMGMQGIA